MFSHCKSIVSRSGSRVGKVLAARDDVASFFCSEPVRPMTCARLLCQSAAAASGLFSGKAVRVKRRLQSQSTFSILFLQLWQVSCWFLLLPRQDPPCGPPLLSEWWSLVKGFCVVRVKGPKLACASSGSLAGPLWEALAALESRGTHNANQQPTNQLVASSLLFPSQGHVGGN